MIFGQRQGPVREIHAGSGYWSQDSSVQVLANDLSVRPAEKRVERTDQAPVGGDVHLDQFLEHLGIEMSERRQNAERRERR